jgi:DNA-binding transcriptional LysR family regulator
VTSAAAILNVSQPSVSKVLAHAEQQLGYQLFERNKGRLIPTPEAHQLFKHVTEVYQSVDRLRHISSNLRVAGAGRIRVACTPAIGLELLPRAVATFREAHPDTVFDVETLHLDEIINALMEARVDVGFAFDTVVRPGIDAQTLASARFVVIAPPDSHYADGQPLAIGDLADTPFIGLNDRGPLGRLLSNHFATSDTRLNVVVRSETYHIAKALVAMGTGVAIADEISARSSISGDVRILPLRPTLTFDIKALHASSTPLSIMTNTFVRHLETCIVDFLK